MSKKLLAWLIVAAMMLLPVFAVAEGEYAPLEPMKELLTLKVVHQYDLSSAGDIAEGMTPEKGLWNDVILEDLNIKFDWMWTVTSDQWAQKFQLAVSSGDIPDVMTLNEVQFRTFVEANGLRDLTEAYDRWTLNEMKAMDDSLGNGPTRQSTVDGKLLGVPRFENTHSSMYLYFYRKDWADKLGIEQPKNIYEVMAMAEAFATQDPDGNGEDDTIGLGMTSSPFSGAFGTLAFFQSFGGYPQFWIEKDGEVIPGIIQDETLAGLKALREMYAKGNNTIAQDFSSMSGDMLNERVINGKVGVVYGMWWNPAWPLNLSLQADNEAMWEVLPITSETDNVVGKSIMNESGVSFYNVVYKNAPEHAEEGLIKLLNRDYVYLAPVDPQTWPQEPIPTTEEEIEARRERDKQRLYDGWVWNWIPVQTWPANGNVDQAIVANKAYRAFEKGEDPMEYLRTVGDKDWYDKTVDYWTKGKGDPEYGNFWGMWASRTSENGGILTTVRLMEEGNVVPNIYYGPATETEQQVKSSLTTMSEEYFVKFIMGEADEGSWEGFVNDWLVNGGQDWWDEVAEARAAFVGG